LRGLLKHFVACCLAAFLMTGCDLGGSSAGIFVSVNYNGSAALDVLFVEVTATGAMWTRSAELILDGAGFPTSFAIEIEAALEEDLLTPASLCVDGMVMNVPVVTDCTDIVLISGEVTDVSLLLQDLPTSDSGTGDGGSTDAGPLDAGPDAS